MTKTLCQLFLHLSNFFVWPHITVDSHLSHSCNISGIPLNLAQMSVWTRGSTGQGHCHCPKYTVVPNSRIHELIKAKLHTNVKVSDDILSKRSLWHHNVLQKHFFFGHYSKIGTQEQKRRLWPYFTDVSTLKLHWLCRSSLLPGLTCVKHPGFTIHIWRIVVHQKLTGSANIGLQVVVLHHQSRQTWKYHDVAKSYKNKVQYGCYRNVPKLLSTDGNSFVLTVRLILSHIHWNLGGPGEMNSTYFQFFFSFFSGNLVALGPGAREERGGGKHWWQTHSVLV